MADGGAAVVAADNEERRVGDAVVGEVEVMDLVLAREEKPAAKLTAQSAPRRPVRKWPAAARPRRKKGGGVAGRDRVVGEVVVMAVPMVEENPAAHTKA